MKIDLEKVAQLARLKIEPEKREMFERQLQSIVEMVEKLPQMEEAYVGVDPAHPMQLREDTVRPSLRREAILANAPQTQAGCVVVPKTVE
ncbi:MAG: Asp-tRNA(Asn)/Glu-tRNA(Gln) amidotransferase subunit GatC [Provencibacterium sp.]|jgi:aspartyl-tRNA(Asn)/glutamyl-tRNA(Gln) amidotransferase subunit C|nr:Asp-tRNA(Asn)/Glu-tRNA(Gln) amidotransferase subunit GatC [Provencibacterium sp.]